MAHESSTTLVSGSSAQGSFTLRRQPGANQVSVAVAQGCAVVFDGRLYHRDELASEATGCGESAAISDAELILRAYLRLGEAVAPRLRGIFGLVLWDSRYDVLLAVRDPLGTYPLFYAEAGRELVFSTSISALLAHSHVSRAPNRALLAEHIRHDWAGVEETHYAAVRRVLPGHVFRNAGGARRLYRYWEPAPEGSAIDWVRRDEIGRFDELLDQSVARCLDFGAIGVFLSGGLDSVVLAAIAADQSRERGMTTPIALSLAFPPPTDEEVTQRQVAEQLGLPQVLMPFAEAAGPRGVIAAMLEVSADWPWPVLNPWLPMFQALAREAKGRGYGTIISGEGGDEWLSVSPFYGAELMGRLDVAGFWRLLRTSSRSFPFSPLGLARHHLWRYGLRPVLSKATRRLLRAAAPDLLAERWRRASRRLTPPWLAPVSALRDELDGRTERDIQGRLARRERPGHYIPCLRAIFDSLVRSVEMEECYESGRRVGVTHLQPFWDADLVEFLFRTPPDLLNRDLRSKGLVRQTLAQRFPQVGFERQKKVLFHGFFRGIVLKEGLAAWQHLGGARALADLGIVDDTMLKSRAAEIFSGRCPQEESSMLSVLNLEAWVRAHF